MKWEFIVIREKVKISGVKDDVATNIERQIRGNISDDIPYRSKIFKLVVFWMRGRLRLKCDGTRAETRFRLSAKRTSPFKSAGGVSSVDY
jgi:hypothetical protein